MGWVGAGGLGRGGGAGSCVAAPPLQPPQPTPDPAPTPHLSSARRSVASSSSSSLSSRSNAPVPSGHSCPNMMFSDTPCGGWDRSVCVAALQKPGKAGWGGGPRREGCVPHSEWPKTQQQHSQQQQHQPQDMLTSPARPPSPPKTRARLHVVPLPPPNPGHPPQIPPQQKPSRLHVVPLREHRRAHEDVHRLLEAALRQGARLAAVDAVAGDGHEVAAAGHDVAQDGQVPGGGSGWGGWGC